MVKKVSIAILFVAVVLGAAFVLKPQEQRIAFIDMQRALATPAKLIAKTSLHKEVQQRILKRYASELSSVIKAYGKEKNLTIVSGILLTNQGGLDITDAIVAITLKKVRENA